MADTKVSGLTAVTTPALTDEIPCNQGGTSKKLTATQILGMHCTLITGNSGTANAIAAPSETWQVLSSDSSTNNTTSIAVAMTTSTIAAGKYQYRYDIICQSDTATNSIKFAVDATGTVTRHLYRLYFPSGGVTAATGVMDQELNATTGNVYAIASTRADNTTLGPFTDVDTTNADIHCVIEGMLVTSGSGNLTLGFASETTGVTKLITGTTLVLRRFA